MQQGSTGGNITCRPLIGEQASAGTTPLSPTPTAKTHLPARKEVGSPDTDSHQHMRLIVTAVTSPLTLCCMAAMQSVVAAGLTQAGHVHGLSQASATSLVVDHVLFAVSRACAAAAYMIMNLVARSRARLQKHHRHPWDGQYPGEKEGTPAEALARDRSPAPAYGLPSPVALHSRGCRRKRPSDCRAAPTPPRLRPGLRGATAWAAPMA